MRQDPSKLSKETSESNDLSVDDDDDDDDGRRRRCSMSSEKIQGPEMGYPSALSSRS